MCVHMWACCGSASKAGFNLYSIDLGALRAEGSTKANRGFVVIAALVFRERFEEAVRDSGLGPGRETGRVLKLVFIGV